MGEAAQPVGEQARPILVFFHSPASGRCRRVEGFIAQILQRRRNHDTFTLIRVDVGERPDLVRRFRIRDVPAIAVVEGKRVAIRLEDPTGIPKLEEALRPWLR